MTANGRTGVAGIVAEVGRRTGRLATFPVRVAVRSPAAADARRRLEDAAVEAVGTPEMGRVVDHVLAGPLPEALTRSMLANNVAERVAAEAAQDVDIDTALARALDSSVTRATVQRLVRSAEFQDALEAALSSPAVRAALAEQGSSVAAETAAALRRRLAAFDDAIERRPRRWFRRPPRASAPREGGLAIRGVALCLDALLAHVAFFMGVAMIALVTSLAGRLPSVWAEGAAAAGWTILVGGYFVFFWTTVGRTPGMLALHLRVETSSGTLPGLGRSCVRLAGLAVAISALLLGFLPVLVSDRRRALPDYLADTVVVRDDAEGDTCRPKHAE